ncbi:hypothetical protein CC78DRAFT_576258 [Lojkania enalia]|uniref:Uncharacterized protein n=1 Tax=Lojkania enalia TaxID=147567 RepID=A0A9P4KGD4_9PLEO|nr:hypothetical protein CC78DRAFT_576258 [Didymosphaeria enalia]
MGELQRQADIRQPYPIRPRGVSAGSGLDPTAHFDRDDSKRPAVLRAGWADDAVAQRAENSLAKHSEARLIVGPVSARSSAPSGGPTGAGADGALGNVTPPQNAPGDPGPTQTLPRLRQTCIDDQGIDRIDRTLAASEERPSEAIHAPLQALLAPPSPPRLERHPTVHRFLSLVLFAACAERPGFPLQLPPCP